MVSVPTEPSIHVTVEHGGLDTSHMKIEDFTSQQLSDRIEYAGIDHMEEICSVETVDTGSPSGNLSPPSPPPLHVSHSLRFHESAVIRSYRICRHRSHGRDLFCRDSGYW